MRPRAGPRAPAALLGLCGLLLLLLLLGPGRACPAGCACPDPLTVDCRGRGLPSMPDPFPLDVRKLLAAGNRIQRLPEDLFLLHGDLVYLDLGNNSLRALEEGAFRGSARLAFLDLSHNNLSRLGAGAFRSAAGLVRLSLAHNRLQGVHEAAFESLESLQVLELHGNELRGLSVAALAALPALRSLRLDGNPWLCDCDFAHLFAWIQENASKLPKGEWQLFTLPAQVSAAGKKSLVKGTEPREVAAGSECGPGLCVCSVNAAPRTRNPAAFLWVTIASDGLNAIWANGLDEIQCSLPPENRRVFLHQLSEASFSECKFSLSLTDLFIIIFSGVAVSIAAIISSFVLATVVQCFQRCTPSKDAEEEDEDEDD